MFNCPNANTDANPSRYKENREPGKPILEAGNDNTQGPGGILSSHSRSIVSWLSETAVKMEMIHRKLNEIGFRDMNPELNKAIEEAHKDLDIASKNDRFGHALDLQKMMAYARLINEAANNTIEHLNFLF